MGENSLSHEDRVISLGPGTFAISERLLLAHARGEVLFITGAGTSQPANLPDFRGMVQRVYDKVESTMAAALTAAPKVAAPDWQPPQSALVDDQNAELKRFVLGDYDVTLGMLERRLDQAGVYGTIVRDAVVEVLNEAGKKPAELHGSLVRLANRGVATTILTTNYDLLLERAAQNQKVKVRTSALGNIPRPSRRAEFSGVLHIHGALPGAKDDVCELVLTDRDFGEYYLRRRIVPDLIYDAARLFNLVLVGYSANDAPMRYLLNAVAADGSRFTDLRERFIFVGGDEAPDPVAVSDWRARGITPITYYDGDKHAALARGLRSWAKFSANTADVEVLDATMKKGLRRQRASVDEHERDLTEHLFRRANAAERSRFMKLANSVKADPAWLDAFAAIVREKSK